ncbi:MAG: hypothetical protein QOF21_2986 [Actinomycetota bacterium]|jgi:hypothetical protein
MTRDEARDALTEKFSARLNAIALVDRANGNDPNIPGEVSFELARSAIEWFAQHGFAFDTKTT